MKRVSCAVMLVVLFSLWWAGPGASAQGGSNACPAIVQAALAMADQLCASIGRNQACYGHVLIQAEPKPDAVGFAFDGLGDVVDVAALHSLRLSAMDLDSGAWGVALMRIQADLPATLPGQNVTLLLFGNVTITSAEEAAAGAQMEVAVRDGTVVVDAPSLAGVPLADPLAATTLTADGRTADGLWLRVRLPDGRPGWVMGVMVSSPGDFSALPVVEETAGDAAGVTFGPMQAFYFASGFGDAACVEAPESGLLVQTPEGGGPITLWVNGATLQLGSTAYLQAQAAGEMTINILEGQGQVTALGQTQAVPAGARVRVPLDENLAASGPPTPPEPYDLAALQALPLGNLERQVVVAPPWTGGSAVNLIQNGDFAAGMAGWTVNQQCDRCGMQINTDPDPYYGDYLAWQRDTGGGMSGAAIWAQQPLNIDASTCTALRITCDVRVDYHSLPNSGWWSDEHGGNGEYPALVRLAFWPAFQGSQFDWAHGFLYQHDGATRLSNYTLVPQGQWTHFEADVLTPEWWRDGFDMALTNPGRLTDILVGGSGWDFTGGIDNIALYGTGCGTPAAGGK